MYVMLLKMEMNFCPVLINIGIAVLKAEQSDNGTTLVKIYLGVNFKCKCSVSQLIVGVYISKAG